MYIAARDAGAGRERDDFSVGIRSKYGEGAVIDAAASQRLAAADAMGPSQRLRMTQELLRYRQFYQSFHAALTGQREVAGGVIRTHPLLPHADLAALDANARLQEALNRDYSLREVPEAVRVVRTAVGGMSPDLLEFLGVMHESCGGIVDFLASFEVLGPGAFQAQATVVTSQMLGLQQ